MTLEGDIERRLVRGVNRLGGRAVKLVSLSWIGFPDRTLLLGGGRVVFVEVKRPGGRLSHHQQKWHAWLEERGHDVRVVWSGDDVDELLQELNTD